MHLEMSSVEVIYCLQVLTSRTNFALQTNSVADYLGNRFTKVNRLSSESPFCIPK